MIGAVVIVVVLLVVLPVSFLVGGAVFAAIFGHVSSVTKERDFAGSELVQLDREAT